MKILPDSTVGQRLTAFGVAPNEMAATHVFCWNLQAGGALTLPLSNQTAVILAKRRYLPQTQEGELQDGRHIALVRHEFCHVRQIRDWGAITYLIKHVWARIKTRSILAVDSDVERPCYEAQARALVEYENS